MSWVIVHRASGTVIGELFDKRNADRVNREKYEVIPIAIYLGSLNRRALAQGEQP